MWALIFFLYCNVGPEYIVLLPTKEICDKTAQLVVTDVYQVDSVKMTVYCYPHDNIPKLASFCGV